MYLNHPETPVHGEIVFHKTGPWCQKVWGPLENILAISTSLLLLSAAKSCLTLCNPMAPLSSTIS